jgi:proline dehydrogenase
MDDGLHETLGTESDGEFAMSSGLINRAVVAAIPYVPKPVVWRLSQRYIAGTTLDDAYRLVRDLNRTDCTATIDVLGEDSTSEEQVQGAVDLYLAAITQIEAQSLDCGISVKLSELGLRFDTTRCRAAVETLAASAREHDCFLRIDMEDSSVTTVTLDIYRDLRRRYDNTGIVIQSCLKRSADDIAALVAEGPTDVRLCKGIYIEPPDIAYCDADEIRDSFDRLLAQLLDAGARVGIATHDPILVERAERLIREKAVGKDQYEFQMLLGVAGSLRRELVARGHPLRVYVPFGELWYAYSLRRLRENPNVAGHILRNLFTSS